MIFNRADAFFDVFDESILAQIVTITLEAWASMSPISPNTIEDHITEELVGLLRKVKNEYGLPFQIFPQTFQLPETYPGPTSRTDIQFVLGPREEVYFVFEAKRVNVITRNGKVKSEATKYVNLGLMRFVSGQYSKGLPDAGMLGYVMNGNGVAARAALERRFLKDRTRLGCGSIPVSASRLCPSSPSVFATEHDASGQRIVVHHLLLCC